MLTYPIGLLAPKGAADNSFKLTINTALGTGTTFTLPLPSGKTYDFYWTPYTGATPLHVTAYNDANASYDYGVHGTYNVSIGTNPGDVCEGWSFNNGGDKLKITSVDQWADLNFVAASLVGAFYGCTNLASIDDEMQGSAITTLEDAYRGCTNASLTLPQNLLKNLTNVTIMDDTFNGCRFTTIPTDFLRYNTALTSNVRTFANNINLVNLPENLYYYNSLISSYQATFSGCRNMVLPSVIFNLSNLSIVTEFSNFMNVSSTAYSSTGTIQDVWNYTSATSTNAFLNQTSLSNYASIPNGWKGL